MIRNDKMSRNKQKKIKLNSFFLSLFLTVCRNKSYTRTGRLEHYLHAGSPTSLKYKHVPPFKQNTLPSFSGHGEPDGTQLIGFSTEKRRKKKK